MHTACDENNFILDFKVTSENAHDSTIFADAKKLYGIIYTQNIETMGLTLKFVCMNLKKLAIWKWKNNANSNF